MIIITGASRGIGKYLMEEFLKLNKKVIGTYFKESSEFEKNPLMYRLDITDIRGTEKFAEDIKEYLNEIVLINCAGNNYNSFAHKSSPEEWSKVINTNLTGTYNMIRVLLPVMREQGYGRIINFSFSYSISSICNIYLCLFLSVKYVVLYPVTCRTFGKIYLSVF